MNNADTWAYAAQRPVELLQRLVRFDTTNPPGNEAECIGYIDELLTAAGIETTILARHPDRPNLIARLPGRGEASPLLLYGHVDVVTTAGQAWQVPPFAGEIRDDFLWGRGTLDMKGGVAMMISALLRARAQGRELPGDVILAVVADEENLGAWGAKYLVEEHADLFAGVRYALGEFGGFTMEVAGRRFYPIMVSEKQCCWMQATVSGPGGHGSMPVRGGAMAKLGRFLTALDQHPLPLHVTQPAELMIRSMADAMGGAMGLVFRQLANPTLAGLVLRLLGDRGRLFFPLLHNTVSPTGLSASDKINVIPSAVSVALDGRLLPGMRPDDLLAELRQIDGGGIEYEILQYDPGPTNLDMALFDTLAGVLKAADPQGVPVPLLLSGVTDGRFFAQLGIQTYGFTPMQLPADFNFSATIHAADERIPVEAVDFGSRAIHQVLQAPRP